MNNTNTSSLLSKLLPHLIILVAVVVYYISMVPYGVGIFADSVFFYQAAENIANNKGVVDNAGNLINHWPPLYPIVLGYLHNLTKLSLSNTALYLNIVLLITNGYLFTYLLRFLKLKPIAVAISVFALLFSVTFSITYTMFLSETLFMPLLFVFIIYALKYITTERAVFLIGAGIFSGLCFLTRYAAVGFIGAFIIYLIFYHKEKLLKKILLCFWYGTPIAVLYATWFAYCHSKMVTSTDRAIVFHLIDFHKIFTTVKSVSAWFIGSSYQLVFIGIMAFIALAFIIIHTIKNNKNNFTEYILNYKKQLVFIGVSLATYYAFLVAVICFIDASTPLDQRMLAPMYIFVLMGVAILINYSIVTEKKLKWIIPASMVVISILAGIPKLITYYKEGFGYTGIAYKNLDILPAIQPNNKVVYTNDVALLILTNSIMPVQIPMKKDPYNNTPNYNYNQQLTTIAQEIENGTAILVYINNREDVDLLFPSTETLKSLAGPNQVTTFKDGFIIGQQTSN